MYERENYQEKLKVNLDVERRVNLAGWSFIGNCSIIVANENLHQHTNIKSVKLFFPGRNFIERAQARFFSKINQIEPT